MTSYRAVPRQNLETDLDNTRNRIASLEAEIEMIRLETAERLKAPLKAVGELQHSSKEMADEVRERERRDALVPTITDHALLRYIERVHGIEIQSLREHLLSPSAVTAIKAGVSAIRNDECTLIVKGMSVVTITTEDRQPKVKKLSRARREEMECAE